MKKLVLSSLVVGLLLPALVAGQSTHRSKSAKPKRSTVSGQVSQDAKTLIGEKGEPWSVENPDALAGRAGQQVKVKCEISAASHNVRVLSVRTIPTKTKYGVNLGDAAFRR